MEINGNDNHQENLEENLETLSKLWYHMEVKWCSIYSVQSYKIRKLNWIKKVD